MTNTESPQQISSLNIEQAFQQAVTCHQASDFQKAECLYRAVLQTHPNHPDANYNLGVLAMQMKQPATALPHFMIALDADPARGQNWVSYIDALFQSGQIEIASEVLVLARQQGLEGGEVEALALRIKAGAQAAEQPNEAAPHAVESPPVAATDQSKNKIPSAQEINTLVTLFSQNHYSEAVALARTMTVRFPLHEFGWKALGAVFMQLGQSTDALIPMQKAIELSPNDVEVHYNLGVIFQELGQLDEAEASYRQALRINPNYAQAHSNLGTTLQRTGRLHEAEACYRQAIKIKADYPKAHCNLGAVLQDLGQLDKAEASYRQALGLQPDNAEALYNLGITLKDLGRLDEAEANCRQALYIRPDYVDAYYSLGNILHDLGRLDEAESSYRHALQIKPDFTGVLNNLALLLNEQGNLMMALDTIKQSLRIRETDEAKNIFVTCIKRLRFTHDDHDIRLIMVLALTEPWSRPGELAPICTDLIKLNPDIGECVERASNAWPLRLSAQDLFGPTGLVALDADPLLSALLDSVPVCDIKLERFLTMARRAMLDAVTEMTVPNDEIGTPLNFHTALSRQCFINEYVFVHDDEEIQKASALRDALVMALSTNTPVPTLWLVAVAAYFPLCSLDFSTRLLDRLWPDMVTTLLVQQVDEPAQEQLLRTTIPRLASIENKVSLLVQNQYEENPYPRWVKTARTNKAKNIVEYLCQKFPLAAFNRQNKSGSIDILIAGCGTGQHSIATAQRTRGAQVLAVDLSISSLAYAKRKTQELNLHSIEYAQADLLGLGTLDRSFDVIESVGVLHHLADPFSGWQVLLSLLRPGGFMKLGFYSEVARRNIVRIRSFISEQGYGSTTEDIRQCRQDLMDSDASTDFGTTLSTPDFFSISSCRDLLFHVQEHRMKLGDIGTFLSRNNLQFMGFEIEAGALHAYKLRFPNDIAATNLEQWQIFENENPDTFFSMYQFWIQKMS